MKKLNKTAIFLLFLLVSASVTAVENSPLSYGAEIDGQRSLVATRLIIFRELVSNVRIQSPFVLARGVEIFGVDDIDSDDLVRQQPKHGIFASQVNQNTNSDG